MRPTTRGGGEATAHGQEDAATTRHGRSKAEVAHNAKVATKCNDESAARHNAESEVPSQARLDGAAKIAATTPRDNTVEIAATPPPEIQIARHSEVDMSVRGGPSESGQDVNGQLRYEAR